MRLRCSDGRVYGLKFSWLRFYEKIAGTPRYARSVSLARGVAILDLTGTSCKVLLLANVLQGSGVKEAFEDVRNQSEAVAGVHSAVHTEASSRVALFGS